MTYIGRNVYYHSTRPVLHYTGLWQWPWCAKEYIFADTKCGSLSTSSCIGNTRAGLYKKEIRWSTTIQVPFWYHVIVAVVLLIAIIAFTLSNGP